VQAGAGSLALTSLTGFTGALDATAGVLSVNLGNTARTISALAVTLARFALNAGTLAAPSVSVTNGTLLLGGGVLAAGTLSGTGGTIELGGGSLAVSAFGADFADAVLGPGVFSVADNTTLQNVTTITGVSFGHNDALNNGGLVQGAVYAGTSFRLTNQANTQFLESGGPGNTTTSMGVILGGVSVAGTATLTNGGTIGGPVNIASGSLSNLTHFSISYPTKSQYYRYSSAGNIQGSVSATGTLNISNGGTITGGVYLAGGTITNSGLLNEQNHPANFSTTHISPGVILGGIADSGSLVLNNAGTINGLVAMASGSITNAAAGSFNQPSFGQYETITAGLLSGGVSATGSLYLQNNGVINNGVTLGSGTILNNLPDIIGNPVPSLLQGGITASGAVYVRNNATITGGITFGGAGTIVNTAASSIIGNILLEGAGSSIDNSGTILGNVTLSSGGTVVNNLSGSITSVYVDGPGTVINNNKIGAATVSHGGILSNVGFGYIPSVDIGPGSQFTNSFRIGTVTVGGSVTNANEIYGALTVAAGGFFTQTSAGFAENYAEDFGTILNQGQLEFGMTIGTAGVLTNLSSGVFEEGSRFQGPQYRVNIAGTVINYGTLGGNLTIQSGGTLMNHGAKFTQGELLDHGIVINYGTLTSTNFAAHVYAGAVLTNAAGAAMSNIFQYSSSTITNAGSAQNVSLRSNFPGVEPSFTNLSSGTVNGVQVGFHVTLVDQGTLAGSTYIQNGGALSFGAGLAAGANSQAQLLNKGTVLNSVVSFGTITNTSSGLISGDVAMPVRGLNNQGTIQGNVTGSATGSVTNSGRIFGSLEGTWSSASNTGTITGNFLQTTSSAGGFSISNAGIVGGEFGIYGGGTAVNKNGGNVTGAAVLGGAYSTLA
ncbi:MAG: hypothetical protein J2P17_18965, partial [Mycobacterium sp.]|nr:hypothetical protein [Mycobacterium sp.]